MNLFKTQHEFVKPQRLVWKLESAAGSTLAEKAPRAEEGPSLSRKPSLKELEKQIQYWEKQLSPQGKRLWEDKIKGDLEKSKKDFAKDAKGTLIQSSLVTSGPKANVYGELINNFNYRVDQDALSCLKRIMVLDQKFEARKKATANEEQKEQLKQEYEAAVTALRQSVNSEFQDVSEQFAATTTGLGKGMIDSREELALLDQNMNILKDAGLSELLVKLTKGKNLHHRDYEKILDGLGELMGKGIDISRLDRTTDSVREIETAGKTAILHLMTPGQRFKLGELLVKKAKQGTKFTKEQARQGLITLSGMEFLDIEQLNVLLTQLGTPLKSDEEKDIRKTHEMIKEARKKMQDYMEKGGGGNWLTTHGTGSNLLIYEIFGRIGLLGAVLPFVLNINRPDEWPYIMKDPVWLGTVALTGLAMDHITGGVGHGKVTALGLKIGEKKEKESLTERENRILRKLDPLIGNFSEVFKFFKKMLPALNLKAQKYDDANPGKRYQAKLADFVDENGVLPPEFKAIAEHGLSGLSPSETEEMINNFFSPFRYDLGLTNTPDMEEVLAGSSARRGLSPASVVT